MSARETANGTADLGGHTLPPIVNQGQWGGPKATVKTMGILSHWYLLLALLGILIVVVALAFGISMTL